MGDDLDRLIQDASAGDAPSAEALLQRYLPDLRAFFRMRIGPRIRAREDEDDLAQSVCREVLQDLSAFSDHGDPDAFRRWLFLTAYRKLKDRNKFHGRARRANEREQPIGDGQDHSAYVDLLSPSRVAMGREQLGAFEAAFDALPEEQRVVVTSAKVLGMSHAEIAGELGKTEGAVRVILHRALARIGRLLDDGQA